MPYNKYKNNQRFTVSLILGQRDELYIEDKEYTLQNPYYPIRYILQDIANIESDSVNTLEEFDSTLFDDLDIHLDGMIESMSDNLVVENRTFELNIDEFEKTEDIGNYIFKKVYHYNGIEEDLNKLGELKQRVNELRKTILQTSYS